MVSVGDFILFTGHCSWALHMPFPLFTIGEGTLLERA
jgi:hypothetical protein